MNIPYRIITYVTAIRLSIKSRRYRGSTFHCPLCAFDASAFLPSPDGLRKNVRCPRCDSLERHRAEWLFGLKDLPLARTSILSILHFTPEFCLTTQLLRQFKKCHYHTSMYPKHPLADYALDVQSIALPNASVDLIICNHVLEHVPDDRKALKELYRIVKPGGYAFIQVPLDATQKITDEDALIVTPEERLARFGQEDHVRQYGMDFADRLAGAGFVVEVKKFWETISPDECKRFAVTDREPIFICRKR